MKMRKLAVGLAALALSAGAIAGEKEIRASLTQAFPQIPAIQRVVPSQLPGLYEVHLPGEIVYVDESGKHMFQGQLLRISDKTNLTDESTQKWNRVKFSDLPLDKAIVHKIGNGARKVVVFADPNCSFCKRLDKETMPGVENATVYTLPLAILSPDSAVKAKHALCAQDTAKAWTSMMVDGVSLTAGEAACEAKADGTLDMVRKLASSHGINGTPTLIFEDGTRISGFAPAAAINDRMTRAVATSKAGG